MSKDRKLNLLQTGITAGLTVLISSCSQNPITVNKEPAKIERRVFGQKLSSNTSKLTDSMGHYKGANTEWFFHCYCDFSYECTSQSILDNSFSVDLKIKAVKIRLTLPITMWLPAQASPKLIEHEQGHAKLCEDYYKRAELVAENAAHNVIGKIYHGHGASRDLAQNDALRKATEDICCQYRIQTVDIVNSISKIYDGLSAHGTNRLSSQDALNKSIKQYYSELKNKQRPNQ